MDTTKHDEYTAIQLMIECAQAAFGEIAIDPSPELRQAHASYHIWHNGELICWFNINKNAFATIWVWTPYWNRHFRRAYPGLSTQFNLADPNNDRIVKHFSTLRCDCGTRHQRREGQSLHQD